MTLEESVQHVVMEAIQEVRGGCPMWQGASGEETSGQRQLGMGSALVSSGLFLELSWPDAPVSGVCQLEVTI